MPLFPHAALILERGVIFVRSHTSCADRRTLPVYREVPNIRVKASLLSKGIAARSGRNDLTLRFHGRPTLPRPSVISGPSIASSHQVSHREGKRRNLTFDREILTLASENRVIISFSPAETSLCLIFLRSKATFDRKNITFCHH